MYTPHFQQAFKKGKRNITRVKSLSLRSIPMALGVNDNFHNSALKTFFNMILSPFIISVVERH